MCLPLPPQIKQLSNNYKNFGREKLSFLKPGGCIIVPPPLVCLALPGKGLGSITGGSAASWGARQHHGELSTAATSPPLPTHQIFV